MILAIYNDEQLLTFAETMPEVIKNLSEIDDYDNAYNINRDITFYEAKKLNTNATNSGVIVEILPD